MPPELPYPDIVFDLGQNSEEEWLKARQDSIGGSDAAKIVGVHEFGSPHDVWLKKTARVDPTAQKESDAIEWGNRLEAVMRNAFQDKNDGLIVSDPQVMYVDPEREFAHATPDSLIIASGEYNGEQDFSQGEVGLHEIKTASENMRVYWKEDEYPVWVYVQVQHYLDVLGLDWGYLSVLIGGSDYKQFFFERDEETIEWIRDEVSHFWDLVMNDEEPELDGSQASADFLDQKHDVSTDEVKEIDDEEARQLLSRYDELKEMKDDADEQIDEIKNKLKDKIGEAEKAKVQTDDGERTVLWQERSRSYLDKDKLEEETDIDLEDYKKKTTYRHHQIF